MCFTSGMHIKCLKVHSAPRFSIFLGTDNHSMAPCNRVANGSNRKAMNRNWSNQKANPALKTKAGNK